MCKAIEDIREEGLLEGEKKGRLEGEKKGRAEGRDETLYSLVSNGDLTLKRAAEIAGSTQTAFSASMRKAGFAMP